MTETAGRASVLNRSVHARAASDPALKQGWLCIAHSPMLRAPLSTLPLAPYTRDHPQRSPLKSLRLSPRKPQAEMPVSESPHASTSRASRPLGTLFEATTSSPRTPGRQMMMEDSRQEDDDGEVQPTPPRRLLDAFLDSAGRNGSPRVKARSDGSSGSGGGSRTGSPAPQSIFGSRDDEDDEDAPPSQSRLCVLDKDLRLTVHMYSAAWTFYHDEEDAPASAPAAPPSDAPEPPLMELDDDEPKENTPLSPRRPRSTSLLSQPATLPTVASPPRARSASVLPPGASLPASTNRPALPPRSRPSLSTISTTTEDLDADADAPDSPPSSATSNPSIFPSWTETTSSFSEGIENMAAYDGGPTLLPGFSLAFSPRKRASLGEAGGDEKRVRLDAE